MIIVICISHHRSEVTSLALFSNVITVLLSLGWVVGFEGEVPVSVFLPVYQGSNLVIVPHQQNIQEGELVVSLLFYGELNGGVCLGVLVLLPLFYSGSKRCRLRIFSRT